MIVVFSLDEYFAKIYESLKKKSLGVSLLITESPKKTGRGQKVQENPAHKFALDHSIDVLFPQKLDECFQQDLLKIIDQKHIKLALVFAYGKIIPDLILRLFKGRIINIHPSLLPKYRGATPIQTAVLNSETKTGFSIIQVSSKVDAGPIYFQKEIKIGKNDHYTDLKDKILSQCLEILPDIINKILTNQLSPIPQDPSLATNCQKFSKFDGEIKSTDNKLSCLNKIRAFNKWPVAYFLIENRRILIHRAHIEGNLIKIDEIQMEGKKKIKFDDFKNGHSHLLTKFPDYVKI
ncbi:MAG: methionyl-tRNA formyltransferase [Candidatus Berkelbacteria bacterium]|nr:methionyl-tRNA formyltransferase [Candidatus Berkelbacteria bacterium]